MHSADIGSTTLPELPGVPHQMNRSEAVSASIARYTIGASIRLKI